jgi:hypothetical protein
LAATLLTDRLAAERPEVAVAAHFSSTVEPAGTGSRRKNPEPQTPRAALKPSTARTVEPNPAAAPSFGADIFAEAWRESPANFLSWLPRETDGRLPGQSLTGGVATVDTALLPPGFLFIQNPRALGLGLFYDKVVTTTGYPASEYISLPIAMFLGERSAEILRRCGAEPDARRLENVSEEDADIICENVKKMAESAGKYINPENAREAARQVANVIIPGGLEEINAYRRGEISGTEFLVREAWGVATDVAFIALGGPIGKAVVKVGGKIVRRAVGQVMLTAAENAAGHSARAATAAAVATVERAAVRTAERAVSRVGETTTMRVVAGSSGGAGRSAAEYAAKAVKEAPVVTAKDIGWTGRQRFWQAGVNPRGYAFENHFAKTLLPRDRLPYGFKAFDFKPMTENGMKMISAKTLDTMTPARIANPRQVFYAVNKHVRAMVNFTVDRRKNALGEIVRITKDDIAARELQLAIPANTSATAMREVTNAIEKAVFENENLFVKITKIAE